MVDKSDYLVLTILRDEFMATAKSKGWYSSPEYKIGDDIAAMHAEVSELWEAHRNGALDLPCDKNEKMLSSLGEGLTCAEEECADLVIKALCIASALKIDISRAVRIKNEFNKTRPFRHGKKN